MDLLHSFANEMKHFGWMEHDRNRDGFFPKNGWRGLSLSPRKPRSPLLTSTCFALLTGCFTKSVPEVPILEYEPLGCFKAGGVEWSLKTRRWSFSTQKGVEHLSGAVLGDSEISTAWGKIWESPL